MKTRVFFWKEKKVLFSGGLLLWIVIGFSFRYRSSRVMAAAGLLSYLGNKKKCRRLSIRENRRRRHRFGAGVNRDRSINWKSLPPPPRKKTIVEGGRRPFGGDVSEIGFTWLVSILFFLNIFRLLIYLDRRRPIPLSSRRSASSHIMISNQSSPFSFHPRTKLDFLKKGLYRN